MLFVGETTFVIMILIACTTPGLLCAQRFSKEKILELREEVRAMFQHAYDGYLSYASDFDELRPLTCDGIDTWGSYSLTLIDALDTLVTMGNFSEFRRVAELLEHKIDFDRDINVSVFETNIRIVGGLVGAHLMSLKAGVAVEPGWPCSGPLLRLAEDAARRLLPAFDTATGMPYGTVNLRHGVPKDETSVTCTAGIGTFLIEFGALSRLTGNPIYEQVALNAIYSLWEHRSSIGLFGNHIDVQTGRWTAQDAGIGAGVDSFYEYLVKAAILLNRPILLEMFHEARAAIDKYLKRDDWYFWASMYRGHATMPVFQSLEAFWPGVLSMIGDFKHAIRTLVKYNGVWEQYGFLPEFYNIHAGAATASRAGYPLRPELAESAMHLYRATKNQFLLEVGENMVRSINTNAKTDCGYATISNVLTHEKENRMESFFLAETTKYLYLLFDEDNFLHDIGAKGELIGTPDDGGQCTVHTGAYIFNTEAHPVDISALLCCQARHGDIFQDSTFNTNEQSQPITSSAEGEEETDISNLSDKCAMKEQQEETKDDNANRETDTMLNNDTVSTMELSLHDLNVFFTFRRENFATSMEVINYIVDFMKRFTLNAEQMENLHIFAKNTDINNFRTNKSENVKTLWELYCMYIKNEINMKLIDTLGLLSVEHDANLQLLENILRALNKLDDADGEGAAAMVPSNDVERQLLAASMKYSNALINTTMMQHFLFNIYSEASGNETQPMVTPFLSEEELIEMQKHFTTNLEDQQSPALNLFKKLHTLIILKIRLVTAFQNLEDQQTANNAREDQTEQIPTNPVANNNNDGQCEARESVKENRAMTTSAAAESKNSEKSNDSIWSKLVQVILRTKSRRKFDEKLLLERTRASLRKYASIRKKYTILSCPAPDFVDRLVYYDFYP